MVIEEAGYTERTITKCQVQPARPNNAQIALSILKVNFHSHFLNRFPDSPKLGRVELLPPCRDDTCAARTTGDIYT